MSKILSKFFSPPSLASDKEEYLSNVKKNFNKKFLTSLELSVHAICLPTKAKDSLRPFYIST